MFPELAIRELVANTIIYQDSTLPAFHQWLKYLPTREITISGLPLVKTDRFPDSPPKSRNESLASDK